MSQAPIGHGVGAADVVQARKVLGAQAEKLSDSEVARLVELLSMFASIVVDEFEERQGRALDERWDRPKPRRRRRSQTSADKNNQHNKKDAEVLNGKEK